MDILFVLLQDVLPVSKVVEENYFSLLMKGGWILLPIFLLLFLSVYVIIERWLVIKHTENKDRMWIPQIKELISENKIQKASLFCSKMNNSSTKIAFSGLEEVENGARKITISTGKN